MRLHPDLVRTGVEPDTWLGPAAAAVCLTFDVDAETNLLSRDERYLEHLSTVSHQQYGPRIGLPRILALLERQEVPATFFVPGMTAERWPEAVESIVAAGHEVGVHGYRHLTPADQTPAAQREEIERGVAALDRLGVHAAGYRAPSWSTTITTVELLLEYGLTYDSSLMDDDRPYALGTPWGRLAELPPHWLLDDWEQYAYIPDPPGLMEQIESPVKVLELWREELDAMRATRSLCVLTCHPLLSGRPSRARAIERFIEFGKGCGDVAFLRCDHVAETVLAAPPAPYAAE
jgi:peptidoglycan/xylan/chitin deacetylase (PgdA/CDA1 family)